MTVRELYEIAKADGVLDEQIYITTLNYNEFGVTYTPNDVLGVSRNKSSETRNGCVEIILCKERSYEKNTNLV